jgi:hypothetical protein
VPTDPKGPHVTIELSYFEARALRSAARDFVYKKRRGNAEVDALVANSLDTSIRKLDREIRKVNGREDESDRAT